MNIKVKKKQATKAKTVRISVMVPTALHDNLSATANKRGYSFSDQVRAYLIEGNSRDSNNNS